MLAEGIKPALIENAGKMTGMPMAPLALADAVALDLAWKVTVQTKKDFEAEGFGHFPVCMAKTQYSFSADPTLRGAPRGFTVPIREVRLSAGAEFIVAVAGDIMTMPGLPRNPAAHSIFVNDDGQIEGLF